jgi:steroid delta-isomerase-like uncharacterized protein
MSEQNKLLVRRAIEEIYNQGNLDVIDELIAPGFVGRSPSEEVVGPAGVRQSVIEFRTAFPDLHMTIDDQVAEQDRVVTRWTATGTHTGAFKGIPPTGRHGKITGIDIDRIVDGKAVECWTNSDDLGMLQQLGVVPTPEPAPAG